MSDNINNMVEDPDFIEAHEEEIRKAKDKARIDREGKRRADEELAAEAKFQEDLYKKNDRQVDSYDVKGVNLSDKKATKQAVREMLNAQDAYCLQMGDLMNQDLNYKTMGGDSKEARAELNQRLKSYNDAYTMSMMSSMYAPLSKGVTIGSLLEMSFNRKAIETANPDMKMDTSRFWANMSQQLMPIMDKNKLLKPFKGAASKYMNERAADNMNAAIGEKLRENDFDSLVMTPRQVAILKVNFMEQYYVDMRSQDPSSKDYAVKMHDLKECYDNSMKHLQAVSENSGFDMSVVAAEERYFVGLKMQSNPDAHYENIFNETYSIYGASPALDMNGGKTEWDGDFITADEHAFTAAYGDANGSFTVREPLRVGTKEFTNFKQGLERQAEQYAEMMMYINSDDCPCSKEVKADAKKVLQHTYDDYKNRVAGIMMNDCGYDKKSANAWVEEHFTKHINNSVNAQYSDKGDAFKQELMHVAEKQAFESQGINIFAKKMINGEPVSTAHGKNAIYEKYQKLSNAYYASHGSEDKRNLEQFRSDICNNWIEHMDSLELVKLVSHTCANMEQGFKERGSSIRPENEHGTVLTDKGKQDKMFLDKGNPAEHSSDAMSSPGNSGTDPSLRETIDFDDTPSDDTDYGLS